MSAPAPADTTVLVVEDEWLIAEMISCSLGDAGYLVAGPASSLHEAAELIAAGRIDAAVLDVNLAGELSLDFAAELMARGIPVMLTTGYTSDDLPGDMTHCPLLIKPVTANVLVHALERMLVSED